jgi:hypothetical protein
MDADGRRVSAYFMEPPIVREGAPLAALSRIVSFVLAGPGGAKVIEVQAIAVPGFFASMSLIDLWVPIALEQVIPRPQSLEQSQKAKMSMVSAAPASARRAVGTTARQSECRPSTRAARAAS